MKILLPPSEGKSEPTRKRQLDLSSLSFNRQLTSTRSSLLEEHDEVDTNLCDVASTIYNGVLYQALNYSSLSGATQARADNCVFIISAAFGVLRLTDVIPYYKFTINASLWKRPLAVALSKYAEELIVDCRSSTYSTVWIPNPVNTVKIRVYKRVNDTLKVITHMSKQTRGAVVHYLLTYPGLPQTPQELHRILRTEFDCSLIAPEGKNSWFLDVIV